MNRKRVLLGVLLVTAVIVAGCTGSPPDGTEADNACSTNDAAGCVDSCPSEKRMDNYFCAGGQQWCCRGETPQAPSTDEGVINKLKDSIYN